jgi:hypothetical protein
MCIPDEVNDYFFDLPKPSSRTMALVSAQPLTYMSIRNIPGGYARPVRKADNLNAICESTVYTMWEPRRLTNVLASTACYRGSLTFLNRSLILQLRM